MKAQVKHPKGTVTLTFHEDKHPTITGGTDDARADLLESVNTLAFYDPHKGGSLGIKSARPGSVRAFLQAVQGHFGYKFKVSGPAAPTPPEHKSDYGSQGDDDDDAGDSADKEASSMDKGFSYADAAQGLVWCRVPAWMAKALHGALLAKGAGHKYVKRVPTGKFTKTGKQRYRYYYAVHHGAGVVGHQDELKQGAAFKLTHNGKDGHFHIVGVDGDKLRIRHDETGHVAVVEKSALQSMLREHHAEAIESARTKARKTHEAAQKTGSAKQKARARKRAEKIGAIKDEPAPARKKPAPAPELPAVTQADVVMELRKKYTDVANKENWHGMGLNGQSLGSIRNGANTANIAVNLLEQGQFSTSDKENVRAINEALEGQGFAVSVKVGQSTESAIATIKGAIVERAAAIIDHAIYKGTNPNIANAANAFKSVKIERLDSEPGQGQTYKIKGKASKVQAAVDALDNPSASDFARQFQAALGSVADVRKQRGAMVVEIKPATDCDLCVPAVLERLAFNPEAAPAPLLMGAEPKSPAPSKASGEAEQGVKIPKAVKDIESQLTDYRGGQGYGVKEYLNMSIGEILEAPGKKGDSLGRPVIIYPHGPDATLTVSAYFKDKAQQRKPSGGRYEYGEQAAKLASRAYEALINRELMGGSRKISVPYGTVVINPSEMTASRDTVYRPQVFGTFVKKTDIAGPFRPIKVAQSLSAKERDTPDRLFERAHRAIENSVKKAKEAEKRKAEEEAEQRRQLRIEARRRNPMGITFKGFSYADTLDKWGTP